MNVKEISDGDSIVLNISGEIDGSNVGELDGALKSAAERTEHLILDLDGLEYISSAGLRVFIILQKQIDRDGHSMLIKHVCEDVMEIFKVTGFVKLLNIEE